MSYSYWMENQDGNFTNDKKDTFNPRNRYIGIRLQQGVPLLDRDWNELEDIRRYEEMALRRWYIGNGSPDNGFKISALDTPANDFKIGTGRCMVEGFEAVNDPQHYDKSVNSYTEQQSIDATIPDLTPPPATVDRVDTVYLDVWIEEVKSEGADDPLHNPQDLNEPTTVRHKLMWRVRVAGPGVNYKTDTTYHHYYELAKITRKKGTTTITDADIEDLREALGKKALNLLQKELEDLITSTQSVYRYVSLRNTLEAFSDVYELFRNPAVNDIVTKAKEALTNEVYTDPIKYLNTMNDIFALESKLYMSFRWDKIPGDDNSKLIDFINQKFNISLSLATKIEKDVVQSNSITVTDGSNNFNLYLNYNPTRVSLQSNVSGPIEMIVKSENHELIVYGIILTTVIDRVKDVTESFDKYIDMVNELGKAIKERNVAIVEVVQNEACEMAERLEGMVEVRNFIRDDLQRAIQQIKNGKLKVGTVTWGFDENASNGEVAKQYPEPGMNVKTGSLVHIHVSKGSDPSWSR